MLDGRHRQPPILQSFQSSIRPTSQQASKPTSQQGIKPIQKKVSAIQEFPEPQKQKQLLGFLGALNKLPPDPHPTVDTSFLRVNGLENMLFYSFELSVPNKEGPDDGLSNKEPFAFSLFVASSGLLSVNSGACSLVSLGFFRSDTTSSALL